MPLEDLNANSLYIVLNVRHQPHVQNDFDWSLYFHSNSDSGGNQYHIKALAGGHITDHSYGQSHSILDTCLLVGLFRVADAQNGYEECIDRILRSYDNNLNDLGLTCRTWVCLLLELLNKPISGYRILKCSDLDALQQELMDWGNTNALNAIDNVQPRPVHFSTQCKL